MEQKEWGKPSLEINKEAMELDGVKVREHLLANNMPMMRTDYHPRAFVSIGRKYKKIAGKRYRLPRKVKKRFKTNMCKHGWDIKKLKFSYKRLNRDVDGNKRKRNV